MGSPICSCWLRPLLPGWGRPRPGCIPGMGGWLGHPCAHQRGPGAGQGPSRACLVPRLSCGRPLATVVIVVMARVPIKP